MHHNYNSFVLSNNVVINNAVFFVRGLPNIQPFPLAGHSDDIAGTVVEFGIALIMLLNDGDIKRTCRCPIIGIKCPRIVLHFIRL